MKRCYRAGYAIQEERRVAFEQRRFSYADFIPERRSGKDRRDAVSLAHISDLSPVRSINEKWLACR
jgi:hypothetical protein